MGIILIYKNKMMQFEIKRLLENLDKMETDLGGGNVKKIKNDKFLILKGDVVKNLKDLRESQKQKQANSGKNRGEQEIRLDNKIQVLNTQISKQLDELDKVNNTKKLRPKNL